MQYNLTQFGQTTSEGSITFSTDDLIAITSSTAAGIAVPGSGTISGTVILECDLGSRVHVGEIRYYFGSDSPMSTVASGVAFGYKNESFETFTELTTYAGSTYCYTTISGGDSAPRYVKVSHTVPTSVSGYANGFTVFNNEDYVDFGTDGTDTDHNVNLELEDNTSQIDALTVYNSGPIKAQAKLILEPQNTVIDDMLSISDSSSGPWYGVYRDEDLLSGGSIWDTGNYFQTEVTTTLKLYSINTVGTYTTRIADIEDGQRLTFAIVDYSYPSYVPETVFYDDISEGDLNWDVTYTYTWTPDAGYSHSFSNEISIWRYYHAGGGNNRIIFTLKDLDYNYGEDWQLTLDFMNHLHENSQTNSGLFIWPIYPQTDFYFLVYVQKNGTYGAWMVVNGVAYSVTSVMDWFTNVGVWLSFKLQRNYTAIRLKVWLKSDPEPASWSWTGSVSPGYLPTTGGIRVADEEQLIQAEGGGYIKWDNFHLIRNFTATSSGTTIIATDDGDTTENIEVRSSNTRPMDRETYIYMTGSYSGNTQYTNHYWVEDGSAAEQSDDWGRWGRSGNYWEYWYDSVAEDEYVVDKKFYTGYYGNNNMYFKIRRKNGNVYSYNFANPRYDSGVNYNTYKLTFNSTGGFWIYWFYSTNLYGNPMYYLDYYDATANQIYRRSATGEQGSFLYDMDSGYNDSGRLWYTDNSLSTVFKIDTTGTIVTSYLATDTIRGIFALDDGGCWFIQQEALIRLNSSGTVVDSITLPSEIASYVYSDLHGGFWLQDGYVIRHLNSDGSEDFSVEIDNLLFFTVMDSGVVTKQHDGSTTTPPQASYISRYHKRIIRTWDYPQNEGGFAGTFDYNRFGVRSHTFDNLESDYASNFPIVIDSHWNGLEWKKVSLRDYNFPADQYHQLRLTLRGNGASNSPEITGIWTQRAIEIPNVYPNRYGTFYLKSDSSGLSPDDTGDYEAKIRAFWYLNTE